MEGYVCVMLAGKRKWTAAVPCLLWHRVTPIARAFTRRYPLSYSFAHHPDAAGMSLVRPSIGGRSRLDPTRQELQDHPYRLPDLQPLSESLAAVHVGTHGPPPVTAETNQRELAHSRSPGLSRRCASRARSALDDAP
jgi:hypothetical protein